MSLDWQIRMVVPVLKGGPKSVIQLLGNKTSQPPYEYLCQGSEKENVPQIQK